MTYLDLVSKILSASDSGLDVFKRFCPEVEKVINTKRSSVFVRKSVHLQHSSIHLRTKRDGMSLTMALTASPSTP